VARAAHDTIALPTRAIIWDLDDTLFSERSFAFSGFAAVAAAFQHLFGPADAAARRMEWIFDHGDRRHVFDVLLAERGVLPQVPPTARHDADHERLIADLVRVYRTHAPKTRLYADAERALARLRPAYRFGLITDGPAEVQRRKVTALGLHARMDEIILTDELPPGRGKPDPLAFTLMAERLGVPPPECVYVADNAAKDFLAPNALGWRSVQIVRPDGVYRDAIAPRLGHPHAVMHSLDELDDLLGKNQGSGN